jgi:F420-dependent oxidoreductase-like protein
VKIAMTLSYSGGFKETVAQLAELERAGLDMVWIAEAYTFDAISQVGYVAARTERLEIGTGIVNVYSRTPALMAMTAAGCDYVSDGRFLLGLGASGPQVVEGFHGVPYDKPMTRIKEYIDVCRMTWRRERLVYDGEVVHVPLPDGQGTGLGKPLKLVNHPVRPAIPIWWASIMGRSVEATAEHADGWLPILFIPEKHQMVWGDSLATGLAKRAPELGPLQISAGGMLAIGEDLVGDARTRLLDLARPGVALYVGGMGARGKNFYNDLARRYGYEEEAARVQDLYLEGRKDDAAASVPAELLELTNLVGPPGYVAERVAAFDEADVTALAVTPVGPDPVKQIAQLRELLPEG